MKYFRAENSDKSIEIVMKIGDIPPGMAVMLVVSLNIVGCYVSEITEQEYKSFTATHTNTKEKTTY